MTKIKVTEIKRLSDKIQKNVVSNFRIPNFGSKGSMHKHVTVLVSELGMGNGGNRKTEKY